MIINTGSKAFWLGALFFVLICDSVIKIIAGLTHMPKPTHYRFSNPLDGLLILVISLGWWFGS